MKRPLSRLIKNKKADASVTIAILMSMVIIYSLAQNIVLWGEVLRQEDNERLDEKLEITFTGFDTEGEFYYVIENIGTVQSHVIACWVNNTRHMVDYYLNVGETKTIYVIQPQKIDPRSVFPVAVITERGNSDTTIYRLRTITEDGLGGSWDVSETGVFRIDWFYCKYSSQQNPNQTDTLVISKSEEYVAFYLKIANNWLYNCRILNISFLTLSSVSMQDGEPYFFLVKDVDYVTDPSEPTISKAWDNEVSFTYGIIKPQETRVLVFASEVFGGSDSNWKWGNGNPFISSGMEGTAIQISIMYRFFGEDHAQTISTQALILTP